MWKMKYNEEEKVDGEKGKWVVGIELSFLGHDEVQYIYIIPVRTGINASP